MNDTVVNFAQFKKAKETQEKPTSKKEGITNIQSLTKKGTNCDTSEGDPLPDIETIKKRIKQVSSFSNLIHERQVPNTLQERVTSERFLTIENTLKNQEIHPSKISEQLANMRSWPTEDLIQIFNNADQNQWLTKPAYFRALLQEMKDRAQQEVDNISQV